MHRQINQNLEYWLNSPNRKPLLIRGARQVGKSYTVKAFAQAHFEQFVEVNFELEPEAKDCFESLKPRDILNALSLIKSQPIEPGKTLLFLDEIQVCPQALQALRYFKELLPELHVIAAGSLLEFTLHKEAISLPVARVEYLYMYPCNFLEFLQAKQENQALELIQNAQSSWAIPQVVHQHLLKLFKEYLIVGGMPEAVQVYIDTGDMYQVQRVQNSIIQTYRDDFGQYTTSAQYRHIEKVYEQAPGIVGSRVSYKNIDPDSRSRELKRAIELLEQANIIKRVYSTTAAGLPLSSTINEKRFKMLFLDTGLVQRRSGLDAKLLLSNDIMQLNAGALAEQVVGQILLTVEDPFEPANLFFWAREKRGSQAEVDYVTNIGGQIVPIEVKAGATGRLKSLQLLCRERGLPLGIKVSTAALDLTGSIMSVPIYMVSEIPRLVRALRNSC